MKPTVQANVDDFASAIADSHLREFHKRYREQLAHCLRLSCERLHTLLKTKDRDVITEGEILQLTQSIEILDRLYAG